MVGVLVKSLRVAGDSLIQSARLTLSFPLRYAGSTVLLTTQSLQFNIVSKGLGVQRMGFYLNEAAEDIRDLLLPTIEPTKAKL